MTRSFSYVVRTVGRWAAISAALSALLILAAGSTRLISLRAYLAAFSLVLLVTMLAVHPELSREREHPGPEDSPTRLRLAAGFFFLLTVTSASCLTGRWHVLTAPSSLRWFALGAFVLGSSMQLWAMIANPFFSPAIRLQCERRHVVIDTGPYRLIRHPGYLAMIVSVPSSAIAIGSWLAMIPALGFVAIILHRAEMEEQFLRAELPNYTEYAQRVPAGLPLRSS